MKQIFLSYTSSDIGRIGPLVALLEAHGRTVWWDRKIPAGKEFSEVIEKAIKEARCVVVVWSRDSVKSPWVKIEAAEGVQRGVLVPVLIDDDIRIPLEFRRIQAAKLLDLAGGAREDDPEVVNLLASVSETLERGALDDTQSGIVAAVRLEKKRIAESDHHGASPTEPASDRGPRRPLPSRRAAFALGLVLLLLGTALVPFLPPDADPGPEQVFSGRVTFIGVEADSEDPKADKKLIDYLRREAATDPQLTFSQQRHGYEAVVEKLAGWSREDGPFLARATPYVYVAAKMLGADLEVLATYSSKATGETTYQSYFVVERSRFPNGEPTLDELVSFLKQKRRTFIYHSRFSTSSYFLPSLFFREHKIFHMEGPTDFHMGGPTDVESPLSPIDARKIDKPSSTELVKLVAQGTADLAAVWDGTKEKFKDPANMELGKKVYFIAIDTRLPNDLLVCSSFLPAAVKGEIRRALGEKPRIDVGDFSWWEDFKHARGAPEALARLGWAAAKSATKAPAPVTVDVQQVDDAGRQVPASYLEAARQAIRLSGTEFEVFDPEYHETADFIWRLALVRDGTVLLTSRIKGLSDDERTDRGGAVPPQPYWISFADEAELTGRISAFIHSRIHRIRYLWPYQPNRPTLIRDVGFSLASGTRVLAQEVVWKDPERNLIQQHGEVEARIDAFDNHKITLETEDFRGGFRVDPLSNQAYRVILTRASRGSTGLAWLTYLFVAVLVLFAAGGVVDIRRSRRIVPVAAAPRLKLIGSADGPGWERTGEAASARVAEAR